MYNFGCCPRYVYDKSVFDETVATLFDLVCDSEAKKKLMGTLSMAGLLVGSLIGGPISDYFGRRRAIMSAIMG